MEGSTGFRAWMARRWRHVHWWVKLHRRLTAVIVLLIAVLLIVAVALLGKNDPATPANKSTNPAVLQYQKQLPNLKKAAEDKPKDSASQQNYAVALYATGNTKDAENYYKKAIALKPNDATLYNNLGNAQRDLKQYDDAIDSYHKAIKLNSQLLNPYVNLANLQIYTLNKPDDGIATYQQALKALPDNEQVEILLGLAYEKKGDTDQAKHWYQAVLDQNPDNAAAKSNLDRLNS